MSVRPLLRSSVRCLYCNGLLTTSSISRNVQRLAILSSAAFTTTACLYPRKRAFDRIDRDVTSELPNNLISKDHGNYSEGAGSPGPWTGPTMQYDPLGVKPGSKANLQDKEQINSHAVAKRTKQDSPLPWYLREQPSRTKLDDDHPFKERQKLPDLPPDPPPMLQGLFEYVSVELGLDNLSLLDLRKLDPPAALGANLLMLVGSARSEKHLHVSADRFCRWLRTEHKLTPFADGLLGRNELKLKLRRKNRRSKLLASVGGVERPDSDDGISTGWICVHAGRVEPAETAEVEEVAQDFVGFGERSNEVTIVVQMFTEEKRADMDLEGLWTELLERNLRKQEHRRAQDAGEVDDHVDVVKPDSQRLRRAHLSGRTSLPPGYLAAGSVDEFPSNF